MDSAGIYPAKTRRKSAINRREYLWSGAVATAIAADFRALPLARAVHVQGTDVIKIGLVGCGGRGTGAAVDALRADPHTKLVALGDIFPDKLQASLKNLQTLFGNRVDVPEERAFLGFEAYRHVIECSDVVLLALPTFFHPHYLKAAVEAGKHVFCEKIHAVDAPGVRMVLEAAELARKKGLSVVSGLAWRYDTGVQETMKRVHDGAIGQIVAIEEICNTGSLRAVPRRAEWTEMEYQLRDWYNFFWLACDLPGLNMVHNLDKAAWAMHDEPPLRCWGMGGRQSRVGPQYGDAWDHFAAVFEYADGVKLFAYCRQQDGTATEIADRFYGTERRCNLLQNRILGKVNWQYQGPPCNRFLQEQAALLQSIRTGKPINNGLYMARSSMMAIMMTWAGYTGQVITWQEAMASNRVIAPERLALDADPPTKPDAHANYPMPTPGITRFE